MATRKTPAKKAAPEASKSTDVMALPTNNLTTDVGDWRAKLKGYAEKNKAVLAKAPSEGGQQLSFRQGVTTYMGQVLKEPLPMVVLAIQNERAYHAEQFDPNRTVPPDCYSYDQETPHPEATAPQNDDCETCPMNAWGSGERRGKACKEGLRFAAIHADDITSLERLRNAPIFAAKLSTMNSKHANSYFTVLEGARGHIALAVTELKNEPDQAWQYKITLKAIKALDFEDDLGSALAQKIEQAEKILSTPYPVMDEQPVAPPKSRKPTPKLPPAKGAVKRSRMQ